MSLFTTSPQKKKKNGRLSQVYLHVSHLPFRGILMKEQRSDKRISVARRSAADKERRKLLAQAVQIGDTRSPKRDVKHL